MREPRIALVSPGQPAPDHLRFRAAIRRGLAHRREALDAAYAALAGRADAVANVAACLVATLRAGGKVLVAGNGGGAAEAQHFAAELVGRFKRERAPYAVLALTCDSAILTAVANDYGYAEVFARQVRALGVAGDVLLAFSTSGESENLVRAAAVAHEGRLRVLAVTGARPNRLARAADLSLRVHAAETDVIQELHMGLTHLLCDLVESELAAAGPGQASPGQTGPARKTPEAPEGMVH